MNWSKATDKPQRGRGVVYINGRKTVLRVKDGERPWFAVRRMMMLGDKRRNVRRFATADAAMKAAGAAATQEFCV